MISGTVSGRTDTMNSRDVLPEVKKTDPIVGCMSEAAGDPVGVQDHKGKLAEFFFVTACT